MPIDWSMRKHFTTVDREKFRGGMGLPSLREDVIGRSRFNRMTVETRRKNEEGEKIMWSASDDRGEKETLSEGPSGSRIRMQYALFEEEPKEGLEEFVGKFVGKY